MAQIKTVWARVGRERTCRRVSCIGRQILSRWAAREVRCPHCFDPFGVVVTFEIGTCKSDFVLPLFILYSLPLFILYSLLEPSDVLKSP